MELNHELNTFPLLDTGMIEKLAGQWINTAEEFLAKVAIPEGRKGLMEFLDLDDAGFDALLDTIKEAVGEAASRSILEGARPGGSLGARLTEEQKKRLGVESGEVEREES